MKLKLEKNLKIINEMVTYFKKLGNKDIHIDFTSDETKSLFLISGDVTNISNEKLNDIYENHNFKLIRYGYNERYEYSLRECKIDE